MYCKNARTNNPTRLANVLGEVQALCWDVVCFSETRAVTADEILSGGHRLISGLGAHRHGGLLSCSMHGWLTKSVEFEDGLAEY